MSMVSFEDVRPHLSDVERIVDNIYQASPASASEYESWQREMVAEYRHEVEASREICVVTV